MGKSFRNALKSVVIFAKKYQKNLEHWTESRISRPFESPTKFLPLPGGEGRGEGERKHSYIRRLSQRLLTSSPTSIQVAASPLRSTCFGFLVAPRPTPPPRHRPIRGSAIYSARPVATPGPCRSRARSASSSPRRGNCSPRWVQCGSRKSNQDPPRSPEFPGRNTCAIDSKSPSRPAPG